MPSSVTEPHKHILLDEQIQRQNVRMVLTVDEYGLSAPITFDTIRSQSLPLAKAGVADEVDIIRVSLRTAVRFIADLERREEEAFPDLGRNANDRSIGPTTDYMSFDLISADEWVDEVMRKSEEQGANNVPTMKHVAWEMIAEQQGDSCPKSEFDNFSPMWE